MGARNGEKSGQTPEREVPNCSENGYCPGVPRSLNPSYSPSLTKELQKLKVLQSVPICFSLNCVLSVLHIDSSSMESNIFRSML